MKSITFITIIAFLLAASLQAAYVEVSDWPGQWVYDEANICEIPVYMVLPGFAQVLNANDLEIHLHDINIQTYEGCTDFEMISAIDILLGCTIQSNGKVGGDYSCWVDDTLVNATGPTPVARKACVRLENVEFDVLPAYGDSIEVGTLTLTISPQ